MLTVSTSDRDLVEAFRYGAAGYLTKDLAPASLLRAVRGAAGGDLAMQRQMAARLVQHLVEDARRAPAASGDPALATLSERESEVLGLLADGMTDRQIAESLTISPRTVETHVSAILRKLGVRNRAEAAGRLRGRS
jgi:DNA-binding NarL/FixJ family response regulator